ncbi:restriction endonuclease subunit S, partial [Rodentibacter myodis]
FTNQTEMPFEIPESWVWVRLDDIGIYKKGPFGSSLTKSMFIPKSPTAIKVYEQKNAIKKNELLGDYYISYDYFISNMQAFEVFAGDIIVSCAGTIGETFIMPNNIEKGIINQALMKINLSKNIDINYFLLYFDYILKASSQSNSMGTAIKNIPPFSVFKNLFFALPPLAEQHRIVAKIEELLPFIDQYVKKEQELTALHQNFPQQLKKSILQAAIQGKLTEQDPNNEPAIELVKRIQQEKVRLISEKKLKKTKPFSEIVIRDNIPYEMIDGVERCIADEVPFKLPENWCWVRLWDITYQLGQKIPRATFCYIDVGSIDNKKYKVLDNLNIIEPDKAPSRARKIVQKGTILYSTVRPYLQNICILGNDFPYEPIASTAFATMETYSDIYNRFLFYYLLSPTFTAFVNNAMVGVAYPAINDENLYKIIVPLPPLAEQHRIVAKIEQLFSLVEKLK